jgi:hypothetical protein
MTDVLAQEDNPATALIAAPVLTRILAMLLDSLILVTLLGGGVYLAFLGSNFIIFPRSSLLEWAQLLDHLAGASFDRASSRSDLFCYFRPRPGRPPGKRLTGWSRTVKGAVSSLHCLLGLFIGCRV